MRTIGLRWAAGAVAAALLMGASAAQARAVLHAPNHKRTASTSGNWAGYAIDGSNATQVIGSWTQPYATCGVGETSWSSPWVGIDGDTSNTVEQTGTDSDCNGGTPSYYAWYEMYPKNAINVSIPVHPGDNFTGEVSYASGVFTITLTDDTTGATFTTRQSSKKAARSSVEWIMEGPTTSGLTDFGSIPFGSVANGNDTATISGKSGGLGSFSNPEEITMTSSSGLVRAQPSALSGSAFTVAWKHS